MGFNQSFESISTTNKNLTYPVPVLSTMRPSMRGGVSQICVTRSDIRALRSLAVISLNLAVRPTTEDVIGGISSLSIASED